METYIATSTTENHLNNNKLKPRIGIKQKWKHTLATTDIDKAMNNNS